MSSSYSRRGALGFSALGFSMLFLTPFAAMAQAMKMSKKVAGYQETPKGNHSCAVCAHFSPPSSCQIVQGTISPRGWCRMFSPKVE